MRVVIALMVAVMITTVAFADTPTNKAIGWENGVSYRGMVTPELGVQCIVDLSLFSPANDNADSDLDLYLAGIVFKPVIEAARGNLNMFAGVELYVNGTTTQNGDSNTDFSIVAGLEPEIFLIENVSVSTKLGLALNFAGDRRGVTDSGHFEFLTFGSPIGGAAVNWYF